MEDVPPRLTSIIERAGTRTGEAVAHHDAVRTESLTRKVEQARSIARDAQRADLDFADKGQDSEAFPPRPGPLCGWCDLRAHCPQGQAAAPEKAPWAALEEPAPAGGWVARDDA